MKYVIAGVVAAIACSTPALADDASSTAMVGKLYGYVELHGGIDLSSSSYTVDGVSIGSDSASHPVFGGAARASLLLAPRLSIQGDVWANDFGTDSQYITPGVALHATFMPTAHDQVGGLASIGGQYSYDYDVGYLTRLDMTNVAAEWAHTTDRWRLYAQVGYASNINQMAYIQGWDPHWWQIPISDPYAMVSGTYFFTPDLALSAKIGVDKFTSSDINWVKNDLELTWGAKLEYRPAGSRVVGFISYKGRGDTFDDGDDSGFAGRGIETVLMAGIKVPLFAGTIHDLYQHDGLADLNPMFGDFTY